VGRVSVGVGLHRSVFLCRLGGMGWSTHRSDSPPCVQTCVRTRVSLLSSPTVRKRYPHRCRCTEGKGRRGETNTVAACNVPHVLPAVRSHNAEVVRQGARPGPVPRPMRTRSPPLLRYCGILLCKQLFWEGRGVNGLQCRAQGDGGGGTAAHLGRAGSPSRLPPPPASTRGLAWLAARLAPRRGPLLTSLHTALRLWLVCHPRPSCCA
jgi:hypothetical protein